MTEKVTNEEVLVHANKARSIVKTNWHRKHRWLGHVLGHENLLHDIINPFNASCLKLSPECQTARMSEIKSVG